MEAVITLSGRFKWHTGGSWRTGADGVYRVHHAGGISIHGLKKGK